jgi:SMODS-associated NUDIX domain
MNVKGKINFVIGALALIGCAFLFTGDVQSTIFKIALGLVIASAIDFIVFIYENKKRWKLLITKIWKPNTPVRLTVAYLFRIEENGKYMLIKRHKKDFTGFQPVGGAYKYFKEENRENFDKLGIIPCNQVPRDNATENDLRIEINKRKNLIDFFKWFNSRKNREIDPWREFFEELIESGILPAEHFKHIKYAYIGEHQEGILRNNDYPIDQFRHADIFELRLETDAQRQAIKALSTNDDIAFVTAEEIRKGATASGMRILPHTFKILPK